MAENAGQKAFNWTAKNSIDMARVEAGSVKKVQAFLGGLEADLVKILAENKDLSLGKKAKLQTILNASQDAIDQTYGKISAETDKDLKGVAAAQSKGVGNMINAAVGVDVMGAVLTENQLTALVKDTFIEGHPAHAWWKAQSEGTKQKFSAAVNTGYALGEDVDAIARRIRGTKANGYTDGALQVSKREAEALARTAVQTISNTAKLESFKQLSDTIKGIEWVSTFDTRTTIECRALDGKVWTFPDLKPVGHDKVFPGPIAHWGCRSTQVPVLYSWEELSGKPIKALDGDTYAEKLKAKLKAKGMPDDQIAKAEANARASMDGQVPESTDMDKWFQGKSEADVKKMIGVEKAKLWKEGKLTVSDLTDQNNRPLTVAQLQAAADSGAFAVETEGAEFAPFDIAKAKAPKAAEAKAIQDAAASKIADVMANPKTTGNSILASNLSKIQAAEPSLSPAELLSKAEELTAQKIAANTKSSMLSKAKKAMLDGKEPTPSQKAIIDDMGDDEKASWLEAIADAKAVKQAAETEAKKSKLSAIIQHNLTSQGGAADPGLLSGLDTAGLDDATMADLKAQLDSGIATAQAADKIKTWKAATGPKAEAMKQALENFPDDPITAMLKAEDALGFQVAKASAEDTSAAAKKAMKAMTGMDSPTSNSINHWIMENGKDPAEFHAEFEALKTEKAQQAVNSSILSKAKTKIAAGEKPTPSQQALIDSLSPEEKASFDEQVQDKVAKAAAVKQAADAEKALADQTSETAKRLDEIRKRAQEAADSIFGKEAQELAIQVDQQARAAQSGMPNPDDLTFVGNLGGSTGAKKYRDKDGNFFVVKRGASADHVRVEQTADDLYRAMGMNVPDGALFETPDGPVKVTRFLDGGRTLAQLSGAERAKAIKELQKGFQADVLLGNWDVAGTGLDNVMMTPDGKVWRIDNGGSLSFRAMGGQKTADEWNRYPAEIWSMRDPSNISGPIYGDMDIFTIARQIERQNFDRIADVALDPATREILNGRAAEMRHLARRSLDFENDGWNVGHTDGVAKATMDIRKAGISSSMPSRLISQPGEPYMMADENGRQFGTLRTAKNASGNVIVQKVPGDIFSDDIETASKALASCANVGKDVGVGSAPGKMAAVMAHKPALMKLATSGTPDQVQMAYAYLNQIDALYHINKAGGIPAAPPPLFKPFKPTAAATPTATNAKSVVKQWEAQMATEGIPTSAIQNWMATQSRNSWSEFTQGIKVAFAHGSNDPEKAFYWGGNRANKTSWTKAQEHYKDAVKMAGGEAKLKRLVTSWHAMTQEILSEIDAPWIDKDRRAVLLIRTVDSVEIAGSFETPDADGVYTPKRGSTESHSIYKRTSVEGDITTAQATPFSRVLATYWTERPGQDGGTGFYGDGEAEFAANTSGIKALRAKPSWKIPDADEKSKDATTWGVPIGHLRP